MNEPYNKFVEQIELAIKAISSFLRLLNASKNDKCLTPHFDVFLHNYSLHLTMLREQDMQSIP